MDEFENIIGKKLIAIRKIEDNGNELLELVFEDYTIIIVQGESFNDRTTGVQVHIK